MHRWSEEYRPYLLSSLSYVSYRPEQWKGRVPKLGSQVLVDGFERLLAAGNSIGEALVRQPGPGSLAFKKSAYNWLSFAREEAPCFDARGRKIAQTEYGSAYFRNNALCDAALLALNGKVQFAFWAAIGDDFHVTVWMFDELPLNLDRVVSHFGGALAQAAETLWRAMQDNVSYKLNAGKRVGNFNLSRLRELTDMTDIAILEACGIESLWQEFELLHAQTVRTVNADEDAE